MLKSTAARALAAALAVALLGPLAGCGERGDLAGTWIGTSSNSEGTSFVFQEDGAALWLLPDTFHLRYETAPGTTPRALDLSGFDRGPLEGLVLYCIYEIEDDTLRLDCEPGVPTERGARVRPGEFGREQTQTFRRRGIE